MALPPDGPRDLLTMFVHTLEKRGFTDEQIRSITSALRQAQRVDWCWQAAVSITQLDPDKDATMRLFRTLYTDAMEGLAETLPRMKARLIELGEPPESF